MGWCFVPQMVRTGDLPEDGPNVDLPDRYMDQDMAWDPQLMEAEDEEMVRGQHMQYKTTRCPDWFPGLHPCVEVPQGGRRAMNLCALASFL